MNESASQSEVEAGQAVYSKYSAYRLTMHLFWDFLIDISGDAQLRILNSSTESISLQII